MCVDVGVHLNPSTTWPEPCWEWPKAGSTELGEVPEHCHIGWGWESVCAGLGGPVTPRPLVLTRHINLQ